MNYDNYFVDSEKIMTLEDINEYVRNKDLAYMLIKRKNNKGEEVFCLERVVILGVYDHEDLFENISEKKISFMTLNDEFHKFKFVYLKDMGNNYVFLKSKPGEKYIKVSVDNFVIQGRYCEKCRYHSYKKMFSDDNSYYHDASCFLFLTYLDIDYELCKTIKYEECRKITG